MSLFRTRELLHVHFLTFLTSYYRFPTPHIFSLIASFLCILLSITEKPVTFAVNIRNKNHT